VRDDGARFNPTNCHPHHSARKIAAQGANRGGGRR
jgi:hypothetical protein